jgi:hypothetical protein
MSKVSDYVVAVNASYDSIDAHVDGITDDVKFLKETIDRLNATPGPISPEDQGLLDAAQERVNGIVAKVAALDAATSRPAPPEDTQPAQPEAIQPTP